MTASATSPAGNFHRLRHRSLGARSGSTGGDLADAGVDSNEPVLASSIVLRGSSFVSFTFSGSWFTIDLLLLLSESSCCLDVRLFS